MQCLNCSAIHQEEVLLCKSCRLPLWNLVAAVQKCGNCGKRWNMHDSGCVNCLDTTAVTEAIQITVIEEPKINKEISASTIFVKAEDEKLEAKQTNRRVKFILATLVMLIVSMIVMAAAIWIFDPYYFYETYYSIRNRWFRGG